MQSELAKTPMQQSYDVFVFGSNLAGIHGAGAAKRARLAYGAKVGVGIGLEGRSYALPTKDKWLMTLPNEQIQKYIREFCRFAEANPGKRFFLTKVGCGLAGLSESLVTLMFIRESPPLNVIIPEDWWQDFPNHQYYAGFL